MKTLLSVLIIFVVVMGGFLLLQAYQRGEKQEDEVLIGGERTAEGCLSSAGYSYSATVGACVREWEITPDTVEAARIATEHVGEGYALTIISVTSLEEDGAFDILFERGEERTQETVLIRDGEVVSSPSEE